MKLKFVHFYPSIFLHILTTKRDEDQETVEQLIKFYDHVRSLGLKQSYKDEILNTIESTMMNIIKDTEHNEKVLNHAQKIKAGVNWFLKEYNITVLGMDDDSITVIKISPYMVNELNRYLWTFSQALKVVL